MTQLAAAALYIWQRSSAANGLACISVCRVEVER